MIELPRTLVVAALRAELADVFEAAEVGVLYCGVGKVNAAIALMRELARYAKQRESMPLVLNFGSVGSRRFVTGALVACHQFVQRDMNVSALGFAPGVTPYDEAPPCLTFEPLFKQLPAAVCGSGDSFATGTTDLDCAIADRHCEVVDMEAYALAKVCLQERAAFACVKYVSDGADHTAASDWQSNVHKAADEFLRLYLSVVR
jgi:adenosylhomocysteine nucleosidase